jgi:hypothetical protein
MSARRSAVLSVACSGDMHAAMHRIMPARMAPSVSVGLDRYAWRNENFVPVRVAVGVSGDIKGGALG